ncbi:MAG: sulfur carrier protein ThiS [Acidaminobacteraceae bacterium]
MIINGEKQEQDNMTIKELLKSYDLNENNVVVEVNEIIIEKESYESTMLDQSSRIEIISFVGGG